MSDLKSAIDRARAGGPERHREKAAEQGKLPVRERIALLLDDGSFSEEALLANWEQDGLGADGVVTGVGAIDGRPVARDGQRPDGQGGLVGAKTVEKIVRIQERALQLRIPMVYLVDSAGARITDQVQMFPGRRGAGRIFYNEVKLSGVVPQVCVLFGPSAAGGAYIPAFCDVVIMRDGNASMYLGSPRMAEMVIGEKVTLEEMGGARMHTCVSRAAGTLLVKTDEEGIDLAKRYMSYFPTNWTEDPPAVAAGAARPRARRSATSSRPTRTSRSTCKGLIDSLVDAELVPRDPPALGKELVVGYARLDGQGRRDRRQPARSRRAACCSSTAPTRPRASSGRATPSTSRCCSWPTSPAS